MASETIAHALQSSVLIIEDHADTAEMMSCLLQRKGFQTQTAGSCAQALMACGKRQFDFILCDIGLPDGDGVDLAQAIKSECPESRLIAVTGYGMEAEIERIMQGPFDNFILKPIKIEAILAVLDVNRYDNPPSLGGESDVGRASARLR